MLHGLHGLVAAQGELVEAAAEPGDALDVLVAMQALQQRQAESEPGAGLPG